MSQRTTDGGLYRLLAWLSPAYPVGSFGYSHGLEWAVEAAEVTGAATLRSWLTDILMLGVGRNDAILFAHAYRTALHGDGEALASVAELAAAAHPSRELARESTAQGAAFLETADAAWPSPAQAGFRSAWAGPIAYPIAVAVAAAGHGIPLRASLHAYLQALAANLVSAGLRLIPLGQTDGQMTMAALEPVVADTAKDALAAPLDDIGGAVMRADLASMKHETQYTRLFRS